MGIICGDRDIMQQPNSMFIENFTKCVRGYHLVNSVPINETVWEELNSLIFRSSGVDIHSKSDGSHYSGMDIHCSLGKISNKSAKYAPSKKYFDISSYRLTAVCSEKNGENKDLFLEEIEKRKNFDYYSFLVRNESMPGKIEYDWFMIPSDYFVFNPYSYEWEPMMGKRGKNKDCQVGWSTKELLGLDSGTGSGSGCKMTITFSMSSQLWIHVVMTEEIRSFIIASCVVENTPKYNYMDLLRLDDLLLCLDEEKKKEE